MLDGQVVVKLIQERFLQHFFGLISLGSFCTLFSQNHINPAMDFTQTPPGMLALDNMLYLAKFHQDTYIRVNETAVLYRYKHLGNSSGSLFVASSFCRLFWRTAVEKISMSVPLDAVPLSLPGCFVRFCKLENSVSNITSSS